MGDVPDWHRSEHLQDFEKPGLSKKPEEETFVNLAKILQSHFKPAPSEIMDRCKFHT